MNECNMKVAKQQSILETQLETLKSEVVRINRLAINISEMLSSPKSCCESCEKPQIRTVASSLNDIYNIAVEAREEFESVAKLLEEQLGNLKLEY